MRSSSRRLLLSSFVFLVLAATALLLGAAPLAAQEPAVAGLATFLDAEGRLDLPQDFSGSLDPAGFELRLDSAGAPRFRPSAARKGADPDTRWAEGLAPSGCLGALFALAAGDSGELYVGGSFSQCGGVIANNVVRYDPATGEWSALGSGGGNGTADRVRALEVVGGVLYAGGDFTEVNAGAPIPANHIARWDGASWSAVGSGAGNGMDDKVLVLASLGSSLYAGGNFEMANIGEAIQVNHIARWDGSAWSALGSGGGVGVDGNVFAIEPVANELYVGGTFLGANVGAEVNARFLARWNGADWSAVNAAPGEGPTNTVSAIAALDGDLYVGGSFNSISQGGAVSVASNIARWDGTAWSSVGNDGGVGLDVSVVDLQVFDGELYATGTFVAANLGPTMFSAHRMARWDGSRWATVGSGAGEGIGSAANELEVVGGRLYVAGAFDRANLGGQEVVGRGIVSWDGSAWSSVAPAAGIGLSAAGAFTIRVFAMAVDGNDLYVGGFFDEAGGVPVNNLARYDLATGTWSAIGTGTGNGANNGVRALLIEGSDLYVAGDFTQVNVGDPITANGIARWDGAAWSTLGSGAGQGVNNRAVSLAMCGGDLYVGGAFTEANVGDPLAANRIARWDGANWSPLGSGAGNGVSSEVMALACLDGELIAAGAFVNANMGEPVTVNRIARWDGAAWSALGSGSGKGANGFVVALAVSGSELYIGGTFTQVNLGEAVPANRVARWDGAAWSPLGSGAGGLDGQVYSLVVDGVDLYVGGDFTLADATGGAVSTSRVAHWTGSDWAGLGSGANNVVRALALASADLLAVGGDFSSVGGRPAGRMGLYSARGTLEVVVGGDLGGGDLGGADFVAGKGSLGGSVVGSPGAIDCPGTCTDRVAWDTPITLTAVPDPGYRLLGWAGGGCSGVEPCVVRLSGEDIQVNAAFEIVEEADLAIGVGDQQDPPLAGQSVVYAVQVSNLAPVFQASNIVVTSSLPTGLALVATQGCAEDPVGLPTCTLGSLEAGQALGFTVEAAVDAGAPEMVTFEVCVDGSDTDPVATNDCATETTTLDVVAPTVIAVEAPGSSAAGSLGTCETLRRWVGPLRVRFSETLRTPDTVDPASATNPANYRLVRAAVGADFATTDCSSGGGGDTVIPILAASWDGPARTTTLAFDPDAVPLADGLYRLLVCGSLEDGVGNALDGGAGVGSDFALGFRADLHNRFAEGHFDTYDSACSLDAWTSTGIGPEIDDEDVEGSPLSGSVQNFSLGVGLDLAQCVDLAENGLYDLRGDLLVGESGGDPAAVELFCESFDDVACAGSSLGSSVIELGIAGTSGLFQPLELDFTAPVGTASALCGVIIDPADTTDLDVRLDRLRLEEQPFFADGFESGDLLGWGASSP